MDAATQGNESEKRKIVDGERRTLTMTKQSTNTVPFCLLVCSPVGSHKHLNMFSPLAAICVSTVGFERIRGIKLMELVG